MSEEGSARRRRQIEQALLEVDEYVAYLCSVRRMSEHTARAYKTDLGSFVRWCEREGVDPLHASRPRLRGYLSSMVSAGYADKTINRRLSSLRTFYRWLDAHGKAEADETESLPGRKLAKVLPHTMTDDEVSEICEACDTGSAEGLRDRAFLELLYASGARISEMAQLKPSDIDFAHGEVRLFGKGSKERIVPLYPQALEWLRRYLATARPELASQSKGAPHAKSLFVSVRGNDMSAAALRARFERMVAKAGLERGYTPHAMRHTYATELLSGGADLKSVQELLGHESLATTQIYTHLSIDRLKQAAKQAHPRGQA